MSLLVSNLIQARASELFREIDPDANVEVTISYNIHVSSILYGDRKERTKLYDKEFQILKEFNNYPIDFHNHPDRD